MSYKKAKKLDYIEDEIWDISHTLVRIVNNIEATMRSLEKLEQRIDDLEKRLKLEEFNRRYVG